MRVSINELFSNLADRVMWPDFVEPIAGPYYEL